MTSDKLWTRRWDLGSVLVETVKIEKVQIAKGREKGKPQVGHAWRA